MTPARFKAIRIAAGLTQPDLAARIGRSRSMVAKYETVRIPPHAVPLLIRLYMEDLAKNTTGEPSKPAKRTRSGK